MRFEVVSKKLSNMKNTMYRWEIKDQIVLFSWTFSMVFLENDSFFETTYETKTPKVAWFLSILISVEY